MFYGEFAYAILAPLTILGVIVLAVLALSGRSEPDTRGERAYVLYLSLVSFIALFTIVFALANLSSTATHSLIDGADECLDPYSPECIEGPGFDSGSGGEVRVREAIDASAVALVAIGVLVLHRRRTRRLVDDPGFPGSAAARTFGAYLYAVSFTAIALIIGATAIALPALVRAIGPGLTALGSPSAERDGAITDLVPALVTGGVSLAIYLTHWRAADRLRRGDEG
ncbi:MAG: hypothetical protein M3271_08970 [Actinomycetota bacterium]|nr:hypothetical protein [Actinomycetota bacterium]